MEDEESNSNSKKPGVRTTSKNGKSSDDSDSSVNGNNSNQQSEDGSSNSNNQNEQNGSSNSGTSDADKSKASKEYFELTLAPLLENDCISCHVGPRVPNDQLAGPRGDEEIYVVEVMFERMTDGTSSTANAFYNRASNADNDHPGGDRCAVDQAICDSIIQFGQLWYEDDGSQAPKDPEFGLLNLAETASVSNYAGYISGWAFNSVQAADQVMVEIYNGTAAAGTLLVSTLADGPATPIDGTEIPAGNHEFSVKIPNEMIDNGNEMDINAYAVINGDRILIGNVKETYYAPQNEEFFQNNIASIVEGNDCGGCHSAGRTLDGIYSSMVNPKPSNGGTATTNMFYLNLANVSMAPNENGHAGGNVCNQGNICNLIQQWWDLEFGQQ
ncbi:MAG: hypothetical protein AB8G05_28370 [Oligoflexales bacterium]